jgi:1-deoxy-D-xylulose-5-phosphate synthase
VGVPVPSDLKELPLGRGEVRRQGQRVAILAFGALLYPALKAAEALDATVANMRWVKPLDRDLLLSLAQDHALIVTVEEGCRMGGAGSAVLEALQDAGLQRPVLVLGLDDTFTEHGDPAHLMALQGLDAQGIEAAVRQRLQQTPL